LAAKGGSAFGHWLGVATRHWQRRKMIASLEAMDDWLLRDIGVDRADIRKVVDGFDARELLMIPLAPAQSEPLAQSGGVRHVPLKR
jgi:uncharacterized protein YjiS (DUF1127 family)